MMIIGGKIATLMMIIGGKMMILMMIIGGAGMIMTMISIYGEEVWTENGNPIGDQYMKICVIS